MSTLDKINIIFINIYIGDVFDILITKPDFLFENVTFGSKLKLPKMAKKVGVLGTSRTPATNLRPISKIRNIRLKAHSFLHRKSQLHHQSTKRRNVTFGFCKSRIFSSQTPMGGTFAKPFIYNIYYRIYYTQNSN